MHLHKMASNVYICIIMTRKSLWWKQNNWTGWLPLCAGNRSDFLFQESRDSWPHIYALLGAVAYEISDGMYSLNSISKGSTMGLNGFLLPLNRYHCKIHPDFNMPGDVCSHWSSFGFQVKGFIEVSIPHSRCSVTLTALLSYVLPCVTCYAHLWILPGSVPTLHYQEGRKEGEHKGVRLWCWERSHLYYKKEGKNNLLLSRNRY